MKSHTKAKTFAGRMSFNGRAGAVNESLRGHGCAGKSAGEKKMGNMTRQLKAPRSSYAQSRDGNGGK